MLTGELYAELRKREVLIVDEDPWTREALAVFFSMEGVRCTALGSIEKAVEAIRERKFDVIVCEHWLEGANGLWFLKFADGANPDAVKVLITSYPTEEIRAEVDRNPAIHLLPKPFRIEVLEEMLERGLGRGKARPTRRPPSRGRKSVAPVRHDGDAAAELAREG